MCLTSIVNTKLDDFVKFYNFRFHFESKVWKEVLATVAAQSKTSGLAIEHLRETLFSLVNSGNITVVKTMQGYESYCISNINDYKNLVALESQADASSTPDASYT